METVSSTTLENWNKKKISTKVHFPLSWLDLSAQLETPLAQLPFSFSFHQHTVEGAVRVSECRHKSVQLYLQHSFKCTNELLIFMYIGFYILNS